MVELLSGQGKDPVARWKLCGGPAAIHKVSELHTAALAAAQLQTADTITNGIRVANSVTD